MAAQFGLEYTDAHSDSPFQLVLTDQRLELRQFGEDAPGPIFVDLVEGKAAHRRRFGGGRGQPLARAVGLKSGASPSVIDATAGLARDAFVLASLGCEVTLIERQPAIAALLADGLQRAALDAEVAPIVARMTLQFGPAEECLRALPQADVVYLDPMYPTRDKTALVKKEMRAFHRLVGPDTDAGELLRVAREVARKRVVVKRPKGAEFLAGARPGASIESKNTRYDLYLCP
ncbi:MAG: class I SAM-dependent methyltransferase [Gammaproteobacteria bacterium]|nr:class I SAM-dependent methyltransferase [Gammaproteobacteria bacterium]MCP5138149.1 class I SAM-dependent methyltransferase [Gammaproteobacteria bacterium]